MFSLTLFNARRATTTTSLPRRVATKWLLGLGYLLVISTTVQADPLAESREILFNCPVSEPDCEQGQIADKAAELQTPAAIYEYVRNTHEYALYHGSRSNTINTYFGLRGSDVDIASVLIAMYRSQNIPARYAKGTVRAVADDVANWLGVKNTALAAAIMNDQGIQNVNLTTFNSVPVIEFEHAWVQVQVPFSDYRGAFAPTVDCTTTPSQCQWVDIDPSWKLRDYHNQDIDVYGVVNFDYTRYYNAINNDDAEYRDKGPLEIYEEQILDWLNVNHPGKTLDDVADPGTIIPANDGILPASLPYQVISSVNTYDSIVEHDAANNPDWAKFLTIRYSLGAFTFTGGITVPFILSSSSDPIALADLSTKRITLSYFEGNQISGDDFEHHQMTVRLDGQIIDTPILIAWQNDQADYLGRLFDVTFELDGAPSTTGGTDNLIEATYNNLMFGGYYVIGTGGDTSNWSQVHRAADKLLKANETYPIVNNGSGVPYVDSNGNGSIDGGEIRLLDDPIAQDELTGGLLNVAMTQYYTRFVENTRRLDALNHVLSPMEGFVGIVSSTYDVDYLGTTAFSVMPGGLLIDMKGVRFNGAWENDVADTYASEHFELLGHEGSSLEHEIWQELTGFDAVSTVRGIQMALANGASLLDLDDNTTTTINNMYPTFGFTSSAPSPFSLQNRTIYSTLPSSWSHTTTNDDQGFDLLKKYPSSSSELHAARLSFNNDFWDGNVSAIDGCEQNILDLIAQYGGSAALNAGSLCGYSFSSGTTLNQLLNGFETYFENFFGVGDDGKYDYLDRSLGFNVSNFTFRSQQAAADIHSSSLVQTIRNALIFGGTVGSNPGRWEYTIPSRKTNTGFNVFSVYLQKVYDTTDNSLASQSYSISNDSFVAGGGWVDGSSNLSLADVTGSVVKPQFENEVFTDENLVAVTNNDLVRTPSTVDPVSTVTGNMYHDETDITIKNRGLPYVFTRSYNSGPGRVDQDGPLGFGWTHSYNMSLRSNDYGKCPNCTSAQASENDNNIPSSISYIDERGGEHTYILNADGAGTRSVAENPPGEFESLQFNTPASGQHILSFRNGVKYVFEEVGSPNMLTTKDETARLKYIEDVYNNRLNLTYDGSGRLSAVVDNLGISGRTGLIFTYSGSSTRIQTVRDWTNRTWTFAYDGSGNLDSMTNPLSETMDYTYHAGTHLLNEIIHPQLRSGEKKQMAFAYYRNNKAFNYENTLGETETLDYDLYRQRTQVTDPRGFIREHFYDKDNGALIKLKEPDGAILQFENNADGLRYSKRDGLGFLTQYSYQTNRSISANASNNNGLVSREIDALNNTVDYSYGLYDQPTTVTDKRGNPTTRGYYATTSAGSDTVAGKLSEVRATLNGTPNVLLETYTYYASGAAFGQIKQRIEYIDPSNSARQRITDYVYEGNGINLQSMTVSGATVGGSITTTYTYDSLGRMETQTLQRRTSATNPALINLTTTYTYDSLGRVIQVETPRGDIQETVYDDNGKITTERVRYLTSTARPNCAAPSGGYVVCTYTQNIYDAADRLIQTTDILGNSTTFDYDAMGNLTQTTDANGHSTRYEYDGMGRRTAIIDANGYRTEFKYDLAGRLIETKDANGHKVTNTYDALGRLTQVTSEEGRVVQTQFDANGNPTHSIDANAVANGSHPRNDQNASIYREYDEFNRLTLERDALNGDTTYSYDLLGNITSITDAEGQVTTFVYDDLGRLTQTVDPIIESGTDKTDRILMYDQAGNVLLTEDRTGRQRRHTYDVLNRLTQTDYLQDGSYDQWQYDAFGDLTAVSNDEVMYAYTYTSRHELASKTDSRLSKTLSWTYDPVGNVQTKTDYQGDITTYQHDSTNRLVAMRNPAYLQVSYHYDGAGRLIDRILSNGAKTHYQYDDDNRLTLLQNFTANDTLVERLAYSHDEVGNITQIANSVNGRTVTYGYDALYRLTSADSTTNSEDRTYTYDKVGNRKTETKNGTTYYYCYHATNCSAGPTGNRLHNIRTGSLTGALFRQFTYDDAGRVTQKRNGSGSNLYTVTYNGKGRASQINSTTFEYDPNDYRIRNGSKLHHLEGEHLEATYSSSGVLEKKYLRGSVIDEIVNGYFYHSSNPNDFTNYTFHHDHLNSVSVLTGHNGTTEETTSFDPFGAPTLTIPNSGNELLYTGREYDQNTGLYYYRARYYDIDTDRFISEDPLGFEAGINFYAYVNNNPINFNDPTGRVIETAWDVANVGLGIYSLQDNIRSGSYGWAALDAVGLVYDGIATAVPFLPAGANAGLTALRAGNGIADAANIGLDVANAARLADNAALNSTAIINTGLDAAREGTRIHYQVGDALNVSELGTNAFRGSNGAAGIQPDLYWQGSGLWADLTTAGQWTRHTNKYNASFGEGIPLIYELGEGLTNTSKIYSGAGSLLTGAEALSNYSSDSFAGGGFVLYPSKPNTNMMSSVYAK
ncbi:MAG: hypothetical protein D6160_18130 [Ketobacter sp.]|nr:MAG: hypothetical protein D6160_18130 [Ketobacter sp.]